MNYQLTKHGVRIKSAALAKLNIDAGDLVEKMKLTHKSDYGKDKVFKLCNDFSGDLLMPRFGFVRHVLSGREGILKGATYYSSVVKCAFEFNGVLKGGKEVIVDHLMTKIYSKERIRSGFASATINMTAGHGKTYLAAKMIEQLGLNTLYVVHSSALRSQAEEEFVSVFGRDKVAVYGKKWNESFRGVTIAVINSACKIKDFAAWSFVVFDEVHKYCTDAFREVFWRSTTWCMLGMSATTDQRKDGFDEMYKLYLGDVIYVADLPGYSVDDVDFKTTVRVVQYVGPSELTKNLTHGNTGSIFCNYMYLQYMVDPYRMEYVMDAVMELYDEGHNIFVFATEIEPLKKLKSMILSGYVFEGKVELLVGGGKKMKEVSDADIILTTYGFGGTGVSIDKMDAIVFLTPRKTGFLQFVGRILRRSGDQSKRRVIVDVVDMRTALKHQFKHRKADYDVYGCDYEYKTVSYKDYPEVDVAGIEKNIEKYITYSEETLEDRMTFDEFCK